MYCRKENKRNGIRKETDKLFDRLIKFSESIPSVQAQETRKWDEAGAEVPTEHINAITEGQWTIQSQSCNTVTRRPKLAHSPPCASVCHKCVICMHTHSCTCIDNTVHLGLYKHIHADIETLEDNHVPKSQLIWENILCSQVHGARFIHAPVMDNFLNAS